MIETNVTYFTLPEEDFSSLVRRTTITNLNLNAPVTVSMLDGLARIEPAGGDIDGMLKTMGTTLEAFFGVDQASGSDDIKTMPFYRMSTEAADGAAVGAVAGEGDGALVGAADEEEFTTLPCPPFKDTTDC